MVALNSGSCTDLRIASRSVFTIGAGVAAGTKTPDQMKYSMSMPISLNVGTSGS
jgi:hypothetical protein